MTYKHLVLTITTILLGQIMNGQILEQAQVEHLNDALNKNVAPNLKLEFKGNKAYCSNGEFRKTLDLRHDNDIAQDSLSKEAKAKLYHGRYTGPVFWTYNFQSATNTAVRFKPNKWQQLFCKFSFSLEDAILSKTQLNAFTSTHKTSDASPHTVQWTGDKYISLLLTPTKVDDKIEMTLKGITISGKFSRVDGKEIDQEYSKTLRKILKREFKMFFESEEMTELVTKNFKN